MIKLTVKLKSIRKPLTLIFADKDYINVFYNSLLSTQEFIKFGEVIIKKSEIIFANYEKVK